jgi:hypothetical protein
MPACLCQFANSLTALLEIPLNRFEPFGDKNTIGIFKYLGEPSC